MIAFPGSESLPRSEEFKRGADAGEIRVLEVRGGLLFTMEFANNRVQ